MFKTIFQKLNSLTCQKASLFMSKALDGQLSFKEQVALFVHLKICHACPKALRQLKALHNLVRSYLDHLLKSTSPLKTLDPAAKESIKRALKV